MQNGDSLFAGAESRVTLTLSLRSTCGPGEEIFQKSKFLRIVSKLVRSLFQTC